MKSKLILLAVFSFFNVAYAQKKTKKTVKKVPTAKTAAKKTLKKVVKIQDTNTSTGAEIYPKTVANEAVQVSNTEVYTEVESNAEFSGGYQLFREKFQNAFNPEAVQDSGIVRIELTFVIERDGKIGDVKSRGSSVTANAEAKRALESLSDVWIPAKINGVPVRYRYRMPVALQF